MAAKRRAPAGGSGAEALSKATIVAAATQIADRAGLEAVTFRHVAAELGVTPMALYKHVQDKRELLAALRDRMLSEVELPAHGDGSPWAAELRELLLAVLPVLRRHPSIASLALGGLLDGEAGLDLCERLLDLLVQAGFDAEQALLLAPFVTSSIVGLVTMQPAADPLPAGGQFGERAPGDLCHLVLLDRERFPTLRRLAGMAPALVASAHDELCVDLLVLGLQDLAQR